MSVGNSGILFHSRDSGFKRAFSVLLYYNVVDFEDQIDVDDRLLLLSRPGTMVPFMKLIYLRL